MIIKKVLYLIVLSTVFLSYGMSQSFNAQINELIYKIEGLPSPNTSSKKVIDERETEDLRTHRRCKEKTVKLKDK